jgi:hypothetical protein
MKVGRIEIRIQQGRRFKQAARADIVLVVIDECSERLMTSGTAQTGVVRKGLVKKRLAVFFRATRSAGAVLSTRLASRASTSLESAARMPSVTSRNSRLANKYPSPFDIRRYTLHSTRGRNRNCAVYPSPNLAVCAEPIIRTPHGVRNLLARPVQNS